MSEGIERRMGRFLNDTSFKVDKYRSMGYTKYVIGVVKLHEYVKRYNVDLFNLQVYDPARVTRFDLSLHAGIGASQYR